MKTALVTALAGATLALAGASTAQAQTPGTPLVGLERQTPVREYAGRLLFSRFAGGSYRLSTWHAGVVRDLPVRPQAQPFDADIGPDSSGRPSVVVSLCDASCDLHVLGLEPGDALRPVANANTSGRDETDPSVWKGRLVFARGYGAKVVPYTKLLAAPRARPSDRLAALPAERCGAFDPPECRKIERTELVQMELWGRWVGQSWRYQPDKFPGFRQNEIRLTTTDRSDTRQVALMTTGLGGQTYLGPSLAAGHLAFFRACQGDPSGCSASTSGALRYDIADGDYEVAGATEQWSAWAWSGAEAFHVPSAYACTGGDPGVVTEVCAVHRHTGLPWKPIDAERVR